MKCRYTLLFLFLLISFAATAQNLTGIWRGYFIQKEFNPASGLFDEDQYKYEVQIEQLENSGLKGVTYSYHSTTFYGKASLQGIFTKKTKTLIIKEISMLELKMQPLTQACLMTCYLDFSRQGKKLILSGTFSSVNKGNLSDCGGGTVYLEKVPESDFVKEPFLLKKQNATTSGKTVGKAPVPNPNSVDNKKPLITKPPIQSNKPRFKPGAEDALVTIPHNLPKKNIDTIKVIRDTAPTIVSIPKTIAPKKIVPVELEKRSTDLIKAFFVDEGEIQVDLYDNGEIDNDTITVYHNGELVINHGRLSNMPISIKVRVDAAHPQHEFIVVADNLGDIPPNTALMVITAGKKRYEVFLSTDEQRNAKVIITYKPEAQSKNQ